MRQPDTLINRKHGVLKAKQISDMIAPLAEQILAAEDPKAFGDQLLALDGELKVSAINPGTTADITVATLFIAKIIQARILGQST
jgi:triphosphoribosyl-dephospho-CoA synthase